MAVLHKESVNTLRIHTICFDGDVTVFHPYIRIGRGKSVVDNAGSGGVFTSCNPETGEVLTVVDEYGNIYTNRPDTGFPLIGFMVPYWKEAKEKEKQKENNKKDIIKSGEELLEYGISTLYVVAPTSTIDTMYTRHLVNSILEELDMGDTRFYYIDPPDKINTLVDLVKNKSYNTFYSPGNMALFVVVY